YEIDRALAKYLLSDVNVSALCVARLRQPFHQELQPMALWKSATYHIRLRGWPGLGSLVTRSILALSRCPVCLQQRPNGSKTVKTCQTRTQASQQMPIRSPRSLERGVLVAPLVPAHGRPLD